MERPAPIEDGRHAERVRRAAELMVTWAAEDAAAGALKDRCNA